MCLVLLYYKISVRNALKTNPAKYNFLVTILLSNCFEIYTEHGSVIDVLYENFGRDLTTGMDAMTERGFARFGFKMSFGCISCITIPPPPPPPPPPGWFDLKMHSYQYRKSHCGDKTILRPSYLYNGISHTGKMTSLYWTRGRITISLDESYYLWRVQSNYDQKQAASHFNLSSGACFNINILGSFTAKTI